MEKLFLPVICIVLSSCFTTNYTYFQDPNYLTSDEFNTYNDYVIT